MRFVLKSGNSLNPVFNATYRMGAAQTSSELSEVGIWHTPIIAKAQAKIIGAYRTWGMLLARPTDQAQDH